jgi:Ca-activated chloride channel family protein
MKAKSLAGLSLAGMLLTSVSVWSLTPPGGVGGSETVEVDPSGASSGAGPEIASGQTALAQFTSGSTLMLEGRLGHGKLVENAAGETFVMLEVRGEGLPGARTTAPVNLSLVVDRSGSMRGSRLTNAKNAAIAAVDRLHDGDTVSVLTFDTKTQLVVAPQEIGPGSRERIAAEIRSIELGGDTCISCGIEDGLAQLERVPGKVNRMILLSDGEATAGVRDVPTFRSIAQRARDRGASITTVGVDVEYNERILAAVAAESNGRHYFVENDAALARVFEQEAQELGSTVASAAEATIELAPGVELERVFDRSFRRAGNSVVVPLGAFSKGETKTVLAKVRLTAGAGGRRPVADVKLSWRDLASGTDGVCAGKLSTELVADAAQAGEIDPVVAGRIARSETAAALTTANALFAQGRGDEARRRLEEQKNNVSKIATTARGRAPATKAKGVDEDFQKQIAALGETNEAFASPPPPRADAAVAGGSAAQPAPAAPPQQTRQGKSGVRKSQQSANDFGL